MSTKYYSDRSTHSQIYIIIGLQNYTYSLQSLLNEQTHILFNTIALLIFNIIFHTFAVSYYNKLQLNI